MPTNKKLKQSDQFGAVITHEDYQVHGGVCFNCCIEGMDFD